MKEYISEFKISVHSPDLMKTFKTVEDLFQKVCGLIFSQSFFSFEILFKIASITKLHRNEDSPSRSKRVDIAYDVVVVATFEDFDLCFNKLLKLGCFFHELFGNGFYGQLGPICLVDGFIYFGKRPLA